MFEPFSLCFMCLQFLSPVSIEGQSGIVQIEERIHDDGQCSVSNIIIAGLVDFLPGNSSNSFSMTGQGLIAHFPGLEEFVKLQPEKSYVASLSRDLGSCNFKFEIAPEPQWDDPSRSIALNVN
jgi:hypothetical protein